MKEAQGRVCYRVRRSFTVTYDNDQPPSEHPPGFVSSIVTVVHLLQSSGGIVFFQCRSKYEYKNLFKKLFSK